MISNNGFSKTGREEGILNPLLKLSFIILQYFRACGDKRSRSYKGYF